MADTDETVSELCTFKNIHSSYVYVPIPPPSSIGHRAELWNVDKWFKEVKVKLVTRGDQCFVKLEDDQSGELFAECPLPSDGTSLTTAVDPVIDSSRYYVLRVEDRQSKNHAFLGLGFRERVDSSNFAAALDDYRQYLRRKREADHMREEFEKQALGGGSEGGGSGSLSTSPAREGSGPLQDLALKGTITLKLNGATKNKSPGAEASGFLSRQVSFPMKTPDTAGVLKLPPPSLARTSLTASNGSPDPSAALNFSSPPSYSGAAPATASSPVAGAASPAAAAGSNAEASSKKAAGDDDDGWGDFQG